MHNPLRKFNSEEWIGARATGNPAPAPAAQVALRRRIDW